MAISVRRRELGQFGVQLARRVLARRAPAGLYVERLDLNVEPQPFGHLIDASYHIRQPKGVLKAPVALDLVSSRLDVLDVKSDVVAVSPDSLGPGSGQQAVLPLLPQHSSPWEHAAVQIKLSWKTRGDDSLACLLIPDAFPMPILSPGTLRNNWTRPSVIVHAGSHGHLYRFAGVPLHCVHGEKVFISTIIADADRFVLERAENNQGVLLSCALVDKLAPGERLRIANYTARAIEFLSREFDSDPCATPCIKTAADRACFEMQPNNACFDATPKNFGLADGYGQPDDVYLGDRLAGIWWGAGCRIVGPRSLELECAINIAFSLRWLQRIGEPMQLEAALQHCIRRTKSDLVRSFSTRLRGVLDQPLMLRWAVQLFNAMDRHPQRLKTIQETLRTNWGKFVDVAVARKAFEL